MGAKAIRLSLPYPPSINHYYQHTRRGVFIGVRGKAFRAEVIKAVSSLEHFGDARLSLSIHIFPPDRRKRDLDNVLKALQDALQHAGLYNDDSQIDELHLFKHNPIKGGEVIVSILLAKPF